MSLKKKYLEQIVPELKEEFEYKSPMQIPALKKIVLNSGVGEAAHNSKAIDYAVYAMTRIAGQKPVVTRAKKSISNFKLREGNPVGCCVTLRGQRMYDFLERLIAVALPRMRDFRGVSPKGFDGRGNFTMGVREQIIFPEVDMEKLDKVRGFDISFVTSADSNEEAKVLLSKLGVPFRQ